MARINIDGPDRDVYIKYISPYVTIQTSTGSTKAVVMANIEATDIVLAQVLSYSTACYVTYITVTAGTGFVINLSAAPGTATVGCAVFKANG